MIEHIQVTGLIQQQTNKGVGGVYLYLFVRL